MCADAHHHTLGFILITCILNLIECKLNVHITGIVRYILNRNLSLIDIGRIGGDGCNLRSANFVAGQADGFIPTFNLILKAYARIALYPIQDRVK